MATVAAAQTPRLSNGRLEPADFFFVLYRVESGQITRIRSYSADCPFDAGGKAVDALVHQGLRGR